MTNVERCISNSHQSDLENRTTENLQDGPEGDGGNSTESGAEAWPHSVPCAEMRRSRRMTR